MNKRQRKKAAKKAVAKDRWVNRALFGEWRDSIFLKLIGENNKGLPPGHSFNGGAWAGPPFDITELTKTGSVCATYK